MIKGSNIAKQIDMDFRKQMRYKENQYIKTHCYKCKNKNSNLCNISININGNLRCVEFVEIEESNGE